MPQKKVEKTPRKTAQEKPQRTRRKKEKPPLKSPTILKLPFPSKIIPNNVVNHNKAVPCLQKDEFKIMLANEVVRHQFPKKAAFFENPEVVSEQTKPVNKSVGKKKPILNRKRLLKDEVENNTTKVLQKKTRSKRVTKKPQPEGMLEDSNKIIPEKPKKQITRTYKLKRTKAVKSPIQKLNMVESKEKDQEEPERNEEHNNEESTANEENNQKEIKKPKTVTKRKLPLKQNKVRVGPRSRQKINGIIKKETKVPNVSKEVNNLNINVNNSARMCSLAGSELSWTKDISSSSATNISVNSGDFFLIDKKLPLLKLTNIDSQLNEDNNVIDSENIKNSSISNLTVDVAEFPENNLSSSSSDSSSEESNHSSLTKNSPSALEKLASKLKLFDIEMINWINHTDDNLDPKVKECHDKLFTEGFLKEEAEIIEVCKNINQTLSKLNLNIDNDVEKEPCNSQTVDNNENVNEVQTNTNDLDIENNAGESLNGQEVIESPVEEKPICSYKYTSFGDNDEDDALSLFAESITGMESSTKNHSNPNIEEYVPQPVNTVFKSPEPITYKPTRITQNPLLSDPVTSPPVCMKQNADSTSIYRENPENYIEENIAMYEDRVGKFEQNKPNYDSGFMESNLKPMKRTKVFSGVCVFNLLSVCQRRICKFPHKILNIHEIKERLAVLNDEDLKREYMMTRCWAALRRKFGMYFVEECARRRLPRFLVEMALDFIVKAKENNKDDRILKVVVIETTLLYLNNVDLRTCEDILKKSVKNNKLLCDFFMSTIAKAQNFNQFKPVFKNLTDFMFDLNRPFTSSVATNVLERLCILPYDEGLARALIKIIKNTDVSIYSNSMISILEHQFLNSNIELYKEFCTLRRSLVAQQVVGPCYPSPLNDMDRLNTSLGFTDKDIRYSPDTTNLDNMNKTPIEPTFTRTLNNVKLFNGHSSNSSSIDYSEDKRPVKKFQNWKRRNISYNNNNLIRNQIMRPPIRPPYKRRSDQSFEPGPSPHSAAFFEEWSSTDK